MQLFTGERQSAWWVLQSLVLTAVVVGFVAPVGCEEAGNTAADIALPPAQEEKLGERLEQQLKCDPDIELYRGEKVRDYVKSLGREAVEAAGDASADAIKYEFNVIDAPDTINAFAMPGGEIYFYTGLLNEADTAAEVMSVMTHEVAHVTERHVAKRMVAAYGLQTVAAAALGDDPGTVSEIVAVVAAKGTLLSYGRKQEREADDVGLDFLIDAGWDPQGFISFFTKLQNQSGPQLPTILSSHPHPEERIDNVRDELEGRDFSGAKVEQSRHQEILEVIESGDDPEDPDFEKPTNCDDILSDAGVTDAGDVGTEQ